MATLPNGYEMTTTFMHDFKLADMYGERAVEDTYKRAFKGWKHDYVYMVELEVALNYGIWKHYYNGNKSMMELYNRLWETQREWNFNNLTKEQLEFHFSVTD